MIALNWGYEADHPFEREAGAVREVKGAVLRLSWNLVVDELDRAA